MIDPTLKLSDAIIDALEAAAAVTAIVGADKVFDGVTPGAAMPYVRLGKPQVLPDRTDCIDGAETIFPVDSFAGGPGSVQVKQLNDAVVQALDGLAPSIEGHRVIAFEHQDTQYLEEEGGLVQHAQSTFRIVTEPTD